MMTNKELLSALAGLALTLSCGAAFSQSQNYPQEAAPNQSGQSSFEDMKLKMADRILERIGKLQQSLDCVRHAKDEESLHACQPRGGDREPGRSRMRHDRDGDSDRSYGGGRGDGDSSN